MKLFYRHFGKGQPLIILHGLLGMSDNWVTIGKKLALNYSVFLLDLRNHGRSPHSRDFNYQVMADDIKEFIEDQKLQDPIIAGHSMGGKVAMLFALNNPDLLKSLIVIDISPVAYTDHDEHFDIVSAMLSVNMNAIHSREEVFELLEQGIPNETTRQFVMKNLHRTSDNKFEWRLDINSISNNLSAIVGNIDTNKVFTKPVLFIQGGLSNYIQEEHLPVIKEMFPNVKYTTVKGAGHWVHAEKQEETLSSFLTFLDKP